MKRTSKLVLVYFILTKLSGTSLVVPGRGCGIVKPYKKLHVSDVPGEIVNVDELECNTVSSGQELASVLAKVDEAKCKNVDVGVCMHAKGHTFVPGGVQCTSDLVNTLSDVPSDISSVTCALIPDALLGQMESEMPKLSLCLLINSYCHNVEEYDLISRSFICGRSEPIALLSEAPSTWEGVDCKIIPNALYQQEIDKIMIQWCKEVESKCANLPAGYGYESGDGCATSKPIEVVTTAPDMLESSFSCKIMPPNVFAALVNDLTIKHCIEDSNCGSLTTERLTDKSSWSGFATSVYGGSSVRVVDFIYDNSISQTSTHFYHSNHSPGEFAQIDLSSIYFVSGLVIELRTECDNCLSLMNWYEARVGLEDASSLSAGQLLTINQVCSPGSAEVSRTKSYTCPVPLKGQFVTIQKTTLGAGDALYINELEVDVVNF